MRPCLGTRQNCAAQRGGLEKITSLEVSKQPIAQDGRTIQASPPMTHRACFCSMANYTVIKWDSNPLNPPASSLPIPVCPSAAEKIFTLWSYGADRKFITRTLCVFLAASSQSCSWNLLWGECPALELSAAVVKCLTYPESKFRIICKTN